MSSVTNRNLPIPDLQSFFASAEQEAMSSEIVPVEPPILQPREMSPRDLAVKLLSLRALRPRLMDQVTNLKNELLSARTKESDLQRQVDRSALALDSTRKMVRLELTIYNQSLLLNLKPSISEETLESHLKEESMLLGEYPLMPVTLHIEEVTEDPSPPPQKVDELVDVWTKEKLEEMILKLTDENNQLSENKATLERQLDHCRVSIYRLERQDEHLRSETIRIGKIKFKELEPEPKRVLPAIQYFPEKKTERMCDKVAKILYFFKFSVRKNHPT